MRIAIFNTMTPFVKGGAEILVDDLYSKLIKKGHSVTIFRVPFPNDYEVKHLELVNSVKMLNFDDYDRVICIKYPTFSVLHRNKIIWMCHQFRQVYDLWNLEFGLKDVDYNRAIKTAVTIIDNNDISNSSKIFTISDEATRRLSVYNNINSEILFPPVSNEKSFYYESTGDYLFYPSRITDLKRQLLAIQAMEYTKSDVKLVISGICENKDYLAEIEKTMRIPKIAKSVKFINSWITDEEKCNYMANSLGCVFIPHNEDYGYITLEAFLSKKAVITCKDSGGPTYFVDDERTGFVVDPNPKSIAEAMDRLYNDSKLATIMGQNGYDKILDLNITWDETIRRLLVCE